MSYFDYDLPSELIAQTPLEDRSASKLLWLHKATGEFEHRKFRDLVEILCPGDLLVMNDTRVSARRLGGRKATGAAIEVLLLREAAHGVWQALLRPGRRLKPGDDLLLDGGLKGIVEPGGGPPQRLVRLLGDAAEVRAAIASLGVVPLPPYIHVALDDEERYQTVYAQSVGSAAAPTAGLHFTDWLLAQLKASGVKTAHVTLDVSLDTFRPVQTESIDDHEMHGERCALPEETQRAIADCTGRIVAVGTTVVRTLESFAAGARRVNAGEMVSRLFIRPGYQFQVVDAMITNFHAPRTTTLAMIAALAGPDRIAAAYCEATTTGYRFLSFGDAMLIF